MEYKMTVDEALVVVERWAGMGSAVAAQSSLVLAAEIRQQRGQIEKMNADLLRLQDKIAALEAEVKEAYDRGYNDAMGLYD